MMLISPSMINLFDKIIIVIKPVWNINDLLWEEALGNRRDSQMWALLSVCRELAMDYNTLPNVTYVFEHNT